MRMPSSRSEDSCWSLAALSFVTTIQCSGLKDMRRCVLTVCYPKTFSDGRRVAVTLSRFFTTGLWKPPCSMGLLTSEAACWQCGRGASGAFTSCAGCAQVAFEPARFCSSHCAAAAGGTHALWHVAPDAPRDDAADDLMSRLPARSDMVVGVSSRQSGNTKRCLKVLRRGRSVTGDDHVGKLLRAAFGYQLGVTLAGMRAHRIEAARLLADVATEFDNLGEHAMWATSFAHAFALFSSIRAPAGDLPQWWHDETLLTASARACRACPGSPLVWDMRGTVLCGGNSLLWNVSTPRTTAQFRVASLSFVKAAHLHTDEQARRNASERALFSQSCTHVAPAVASPVA